MPRLGPPLRATLMRHDLLFSVGGDLFTLSLPSDVEPVPPGLTIVQVDVDPWELGKNYAAAVAIQADPKAALPELAEAIRRETGAKGRADAASRTDAHRREMAERRQDLARRAAGDAARVPMTGLALVHELARAVPANTVVIDEAISSSAGVRELFRCEDARSFFGLRGGGIGWGLPAALGVKLALRERPVVALVGDGSAMYTNQALWTAAREGLAVVYVIFNNVSYRILKQRTHALKGFSAEDDVYVGMDLDRPAIDFVGLARSLGVPGERVDKAADVAGALGRGLASGGPYLIDARLDAAFK
jgi:benzoylformate decarboxylase